MTKPFSILSIISKNNALKRLHYCQIILHNERTIFMDHLNYFVNDKFKTLLLMHQRTVSDGMVYITQQEVADELGVSRIKINGIFRELEENNYILSDSMHRGRYLIRQDGIEAIRLLGQATTI